MPLQLTTEQNAAIQAHAANDYPHECCGFLVGRTEGKDVTVSRTVPAANTRDDSPRNRFEIDPGDLVKTDRAARADGLGVVGFYHSHPDVPAMPSEFDREHAWAGYCYVIVSVRQGQPREMRNWLLREDHSAFEEDPIRDFEETN
ncbi:MAG: Mov34/MPN/PAD-1 family protein [Janthinobacterium lividum]